MAYEDLVPEGSVLTGARALFVLDGAPFGYATGCDVSENILFEALDIMGHLEIAEFVPIGYTVAFTASRARLFGQSVKTRGFFPKWGSDGPQKFLQRVVNMPSVVGALQDVGQDGSPTFSFFKGMKMASHGSRQTPRGIIYEDCVFVAKIMQDEGDLPPL